MKKFFKYYFKVYYQCLEIPCKNSFQFAVIFWKRFFIGLFCFFPFLAMSQQVVIPVTKSDSLIVVSVTIGQAVINYTKVLKAPSETPPPPIDTTTPPPVPGYVQTFATGYNNDADLLCCQGGNGYISKTFFKTGPGSFYSVPANVSNGIRSEVQYSGSAQNNTEGAIQYDAYYEYISKNNCHSLQWHPNTSGGSASPGLWHIDGKFNVVNWKNGGNTEHASGMTIPLKKWINIRCEYKFGSNGYFRFFVDNILKVSWQGQVGDGSGQYLKLGFNGWGGDAEDSRIYYDNLKIFKKQ